MDRHSTPGVSAVTCGLSCSGALLFEEILIAAQEWLLMDFEVRAVHQVWLCTTHPPCFCQRVRNCLKIKGLSFWLVQKSAEEYEKKRVSENCSRKKSSGKNPSTLDARSPRSSGQAGCASLAGCAMRKCSIGKGLKLNSRKKSVTRT